MTAADDRPAFDLANPRHLLACGFGAGRAPRAPGTAGTLVAIPIWIALSSLPLPLYLVLTLALFGLGVWLCGTTARDVGTHDHPGIVWDEIVGYLVTMAAAPRTWTFALAGFALFRAFDIVKPWPIARIDRRVGGGLGIMLDDVLAGAYALACIQLAAEIVARA